MKQSTKKFETDGRIVAVVIPSFNEETQLAGVVDFIPDYVNHIVVVDDCSEDATFEVASAFEDPRVVVLRHSVNQGVGGAIATGYEWCRDNDVDVAVVMAGDGQMDADELPSLIRPILDGEVDYSKGNRLFVHGASSKIPRMRFLGNSVLSFLTKIASGYWHVSDSQNGYAAIGKDALQTIEWQKMYKRYGQPNDLLVRLNIHRFRICDVSMEPVYGVGEVSKMKKRKVVFTISFLLTRLFFFRMWEKYIRRDFHPLVAFYALGGFFGILTLCFLPRIFILWYESGTIPQISLLIFLFCVVSSIQSVGFAMLFDMEDNRDSHRTK